ncbi:unnamed protein product [Prorocentrum cordatum]|uniref:RanBP2-type domain-containing protein n=1 Tax=Prorocentrum cordatum TaxID=2364126 RepID=A0ABN9TKV8_9DINO|nr:unnamed protein product [Polarella glacialis]
MSRIGAEPVPSLLGARTAPGAAPKAPPGGLSVDARSPPRTYESSCSCPRFLLPQTVLALRAMLPRPQPGGSQCRRGLRAPDAQEFARALLQWHRRGFPELGDQGGCGMGRATARVLDDPAFLQNPRAAARRAWETTGRCLAPNGALMRAAATGVRGRAFAACDAATIAEVTHADPRSTAACVAVATAASLMLDGFGRNAAGGWDVAAVAERALAAAEPFLLEDSALGEAAPQVWACSACTMENEPAATQCMICETPRPAEGAGTVNAGFGGGWTQAEASQHAYSRAVAMEQLRAALLGEEWPGKRLDGPLMGYVNTCLGAAFGSLRDACRGGRLDAGSFCEAVHRLTMAAGDADTNAAVAGALLGCAAGAKALPGAWLRACPHLAWLERIADQLVEAAAAEEFAATAPSAEAPAREAPSGAALAEEALLAEAAPRDPAARRKRRCDCVAGLRRLLSSRPR